MSCHKMKPYQERLIALLKDTITLLCRNGLEYDQEFCVEGLLGVTLDKNDVFLIPIKELITDKGTGTDMPIEEQADRVSDSETNNSVHTSQVKSERSRKRRRHRELTVEADDSLNDTGTVFDTGPPEWDGNNITNQRSVDPDNPASHESTSNQDESPTKRPRPKHDPINVKSEDVVVIKEEIDDAEFASAFHDSSMDSNTQHRDGQMDYFSQPGTSQGPLGFPLDQLQGAVGAGLPGDLQGMSSGEGDGSWLQSPGGDMQHSQDWQQQKHQCDVCWKTFERKYDLKRHTETVHLRLRYTCDICGKVSSRRDHANHHRKNAHNDPSLNARFSSSSTQLPQHSLVDNDTRWTSCQPTSPSQLTQENVLHIELSSAETSLAHSASNDDQRLKINVTPSTLLHEIADSATESDN